jgi:hypothetical protein
MGNVCGWDLPNDSLLLMLIFSIELLLKFSFSLLLEPLSLLKLKSSRCFELRLGELNCSNLSLRLSTFRLRLGEAMPWRGSSSSLGGVRELMMTVSDEVIDFGDMDE